MFDIPFWAVGGNSYARFRLSSAGDLDITGLAADGEVEDYRVAINRPATVLPARAAYVANKDDNTVSVISLDTNAVVATIPVDMYPFDVAVVPNGLKIYVSNFNSNSVSVIDAVTGTVSSTISVGTEPLGLEVDPVGQKLYVAVSGSDQISVIDIFSDTVDFSVATSANQPRVVTYHPVRDEVWVGYGSLSTTVEARAASNLSVLDALTNSSRFYGGTELEFIPNGTTGIRCGKLW